MAKCYWVTGLSASGKTTLSKLIYEKLISDGEKVLLLDGDKLREILSDESYTREERVNVGMKYSKLCSLITAQNINVVIAVIALFKEIHTWNKQNIKGYTEIFINTPKDELIKRDPKGLYKKFFTGEISNIAGFDLEVDFPKNPDIRIDWNEGITPQEMLQNIFVK